MTPRDDLQTIFDAERNLRQAETRLLGREADGVASALSAAVDEAIALDDRDEAVLRLERLADLCAQVSGPAMADALLRILNHEAPSVRVAAGEALLDVAYERYAEVARAIERALDATVEGPAMAELPYVLAEVGEPSALPLIRRFLAHPEPDVVAAAIEALAQLGDPDAIADLRPLVEDDRAVSMQLFEEDSRTTVGDLARDAIDLLT